MIKIGSCNEKTKTLHWNKTWSYNPQNTSESRRNQGKIHETLEKQGCRTQNALKIIVTSIRQGRQMAREDRRWSAMLEEEARRWRSLHPPPRAGVWGTGKILVVVHVTHACTVWPLDLVVWVAHDLCTFLSRWSHPTLPRSVCFKTPTSVACFAF